MTTRQLSVVVGASADVVVPVLETGSGLGAPHWVTNRGGDVRAYDLTAGQNVYGPGHHFANTSDMRLTNGIVRVDVGARNLLPALAISVYKAGAWQAKGYLYLSEANNLLGARLRSLTPNRGVLVLSIANEGDVSLRLHRGERMLRGTHGSTRAPSIVVARLVEWRSSLPVAPTVFWGDATWGSGVWGGGTSSGILGGSPLSHGLTYEATADGGSTRVTDGNGLTRALVVPRSGATKAPGLAITRTTRSYDFAALVATATAGDDLTDHQAQAAAASEQETRIR